MPNYQEGKIYKITSTGGCYIGSTTRSIQERLRGHRSQRTQELAGGKIHGSARAVMCHPDYKIELVELFPCATKQELLDREAFHIRNIECVNRYVPGRTAQIYAQEHKDEIREYSGEYYQANKEHLKAKARLWAQNNPDKIKARNTKKANCEICGKETLACNLQRHRKTQHRQLLGIGVVVA